MRRPHKFLSTPSPAGAYSTVVHCEYCGAIAFHSNQLDRVEHKAVRGTECPNGPEFPAVDASAVVAYLMGRGEANLAAALIEAIEALRPKPEAEVTS